MSPVKQYVLGAWRVFANLVRHEAVQRVFMAVFFFALITSIMSVNLLSPKYDLQEGQVAPVTIDAPRSVSFENTAETREARQKAMDAVPRQYDFDPQVEGQVIAGIDQAVAAVGAVQAAKAPVGAVQAVKAPVASWETQLQAALPFSIPQDLLAGLVTPNPSELQRLNQGLDTMVRQAMGAPGGVADDKLDAAKASLVKEVGSLYLDRSYASLASGLITYYLKANEIYDANRTQAAKTAAARAVAPVMVNIMRGQKIVGQGEIVQSSELDALRALNLTSPRRADAGMAGTALLAALLMVVVLFYLYQQNRSLFRRSSHLYLVGIVMVLVLAVGKVILSLNVGGHAFGAMVGYAVPVAAAGMLVAVLLDSRVAVVVTVVLAVLVGVLAGWDLRMGVVAFIGGIAGVFATTRLSGRNDLVRAGLYVAGASAVAIATVGLTSSMRLDLLVLASLSLGAINGVLSSVLTNGLLPILESFFAITSPVRLLELANPNNVLLRRLLTEAPGTYHHSIIVGNLAEAAASAVGGDGPLVRAAAYFHDIGKLKRPVFFIENQMSGENPHDKISPSLSTLILTSHVRDGVELAREHRIPERVVDIIDQHHGNGLVSFFYHKALENGRTDTVTEEEFRYEGPRPKTREAAIVMLADCVEAAVRSLANPTPGRVEGLVRKVIKDKFLDGQMDECDLTFKDLDAIAVAFCRVLSGIFHQRVEYPDLTRQLTERRRAGDAGARKQPAGRSAG